MLKCDNEVWKEYIDYMKTFVSKRTGTKIKDVSVSQVLKYIAENYLFMVNEMDRGKYDWGGFEVMTWIEIKDNPRVIFADKDDPKWIEKPEYGDLVLLKEDK